MVLTANAGTPKRKKAESARRVCIMILTRNMSTAGLASAVLQPRMLSAIKK